MIRSLDRVLKDKEEYDARYKDYSNEKVVSILSLIFAFDIKDGNSFKIISNKIIRAVDECYRVHNNDRDDH
jgi:hypothetical protein